MSHERRPGGQSVMAMGDAFGRNERKSSFTQLHLSQLWKVRKSDIGGWISVGLRQLSEQYLYYI